MGYGDWGLLMLFVYLRPPLYPMPWKHLQSSGLPQIWHIHMKSIYLYIYICIYWMLCFSNIYIYIMCIHLFIIFPCILKCYTLIIWMHVCVSCFFVCPVVPPTSFFFAEVFQLASWHGKVDMEKSGIRWVYTPKPHKKKIDVSRTWTLNWRKWLEKSWFSLGILPKMGP